MNFSLKGEAPILEKLNNALTFFAAQGILIYRRKESKSLI
jgi:hypothetical protein